MSRSLGLQTFLMTVGRRPDIDRQDDLVVVSRHVVAGSRSGSRVAVFDFFLTSDAQYVDQAVIDDVRASAMYHNNLGAASLRQNRLAEAVWHLEIATALAPDWAVGWVNLGVARSRQEDLDGAFNAYDRALEADPEFSSAFNNLAHLYLRLGRESEAQIALRAAAGTTDNPFTLVALADSELRIGNPRGAARFLRRARRWYPAEPEVWDGLARLADQTDRPKRADRYREKAAKLRSGQGRE
jgi:Flp pilus assembly protein TadD